MKRVLEEPGAWRLTHVGAAGTEAVTLEAFGKRITIQNIGGTVRVTHATPAAVEKQADLPTICEEVLSGTDVSLSDLRSYSRHPRVCRLRREAMRQMRNRGFSLPTIAAFFGRDHSTVIAACRPTSGEARARLEAQALADEERQERLTAMLKPLPEDLGRENLRRIEAAHRERMAA